MGHANSTNALEVNRLRPESSPTLCLILRRRRIVKTSPGAVSGTATGGIPGYNGAMDADTEKPAKPRRRWFRFSLRTLLIVVTVLSVPLGWIGWRLGQVRTEQATFTSIEKLGETVLFRSDSVTIKRSWWKELTDKRFGERLF